MASTIGTNVVVDGSEQYELVKAIMDFLERRIMEPDKTVKDELMKQLTNYLKIPGTTAVYHVVPREHAKAVEDRLQNDKIPYVMIPDTNGDFLTVVGGCHSAEFMQIQNDVFSLSTDMSRQSTAMEMLNIAKRSGDKHMTALEFKDHDMFLIAQQKLFDAGIVCGVVDFGKEGDQERADGVVGKAYIKMDSMYNKSGKDLAFFELEQALTQSQKDKSETLLETRKEQASYDDAQLTLFAENIRKGITCKLENANRDRLDTFVECKNGAVVVHRFDADGKMLNSALDIKKNATLAEIKATLSRTAGEIRDMVVKDAYGKQIIEGDRKKDEGKDKSLRDFSNRYLKKLLEDVNMEATRWVEADRPNAMIEEKYEAKKQKMLNILNTEMDEIYINPIVSSFLDANNGMEKEEKKEWLGFIVQHFDNQHEKEKEECVVDTIDINRKLKEQIREEMDRAEELTGEKKKEKDNRKETEKESEQEQDERELD